MISRVLDGDNHDDRKKNLEDGMEWRKKTGGKRRRGNKEERRIEKTKSRDAARCRALTHLGIP